MNIPNMTLRDWFAGQALMGDLAAESPEFVTRPHPDKELTREQIVAANAYLMADAMLEERSKQSETH